MYIQSLSISNLRCFQTASLHFQYPGRPDSSAFPNINLLLGDNGAGKTTVLKSIALAVLSPVIDSAGFVPYHLVRRTEDESPTEAEVQGEVVLHAQDVGSTDKTFRASDQVSLRIERIRDLEKISVPHRDTLGPWENMYDDRSPAFIFLGYSANRRVESTRGFDESLRRKARQLRYQRVAGLFEEQVTLTPLGAWLPGLRSSNPGRYRQVVNLLNRLLPAECRFTEDIEGDDWVFEVRGSLVPFAALSDGYRAYIGWIADLLYHLWLGTPKGAKLVDNRGLVLVDEIDLHLHPEWQRTVVPTLAEKLPNIQFVLSTHSPIVTGTLQSSNLFVMELDESNPDASVVRQFQERVHGLTAEQILHSAYFNLDTTRAPGAEDELTELSRQARQGDTTAAIEYLRKLTEGTDPAPEPPAASAARTRPTSSREP